MVRENLIKNLILVIILIPAYFWIYSSFKQAAQLFTGSVAGGLLVGAMIGAISILLVAACFGNFSFTYEKINKSKFSSFFAHFTTGLFMLLIGLSLEMTSVIISLFVGNFQVFNVALFILYLASVSYDFWDLKKNKSAI